MLIDIIQKDMVAARMGSDLVAKNLLITLYAESVRVGKDKRNGPSTDEEVMAMAKKFIANAEETARLLRERGQSDDVQRREIEIVSKYMPTQMNDEQLTDAIKVIISELGLSGPKAMGQVMAALKTKFPGSYDGKSASAITKTLLTV